MIAQIINFFILFYLLKLISYKPILQILEKRRKEIQDGLLQAEEERNALEKALEEEKKILKKAQVEAQKILSDAKNQADHISADMKTQTKNQVAQILKEAEEQ